MGIVSIRHAGEIAVVTVDNPPVNALSHALRKGLWDAVEALDADPSVRGVVLACAGRTFIAGADVTEFGKPPQPPHLPDLVDRLEGAAKPWLAAIHGSALGGGFEVAMGCRFRVALDSASVGLPEVALGIVPGASGTVRTPRLAGVEAAVEMVTTGRPVRAARALEQGLVDAVVSGDLVSEAIAVLRAALERPLPPVISERPVSSPDPAWWEEKRATILRRAPGEIAPLRALACLRAAAQRPYAEARALERATFLELRGSAQAAALRHVFFAERSAPRPPQLADVRAPEIRVVAVVGEGERADDIATAVAGAGLELRRIAEFAQGSRLATCAEADLVILGDGGPDILVALDGVCHADAVLALLADEPLTGVGLDHPDRCIGLRFGRSVKGATLVEIASPGSNSSAALAAGVGLAKSLRLIPILSGRGGFIGARLLHRIRKAREELVAAGHAESEVDQALWEDGDPSEAPDAGRAPASLATSRRLVSAMAEEGKALLAEGVATRASDIDLVAIHVLGFPRWRGGPMFASGIA